LKDRLHSLYSTLTKTVLGSEESSFLLLTALLADGHVLIQGAPGIGKTMLAEALARSIHGKFKRIQFTPDLLPSDILGYSMYDQGTQQFRFIEGPVFSNILLADEINRTSPRIQSALLESMNEQQVSIDGVTRPLESPFMVIATQNNLYSSGTFPLPEPQLDRFLLSITMTLPDRDTQARILRMHAVGMDVKEIQPTLSADEVVRLQRTVAALPVNDAVCGYIADLCEAARAQKDLWNGLSARASIALMRAAQAAAYLADHPAVYPDDVKRVAAPVLAHRLSSKEFQQSGAGSYAGIIEELLRSTPVP